MRRWLVVAAATILSACTGSGSPTTPGSNGGVPLHLSPGLYTLTLDFSSNGSGLQCVPPITVVRATIQVVLRRGDADLTVEPQTMTGSLRLRLLVSGDDRLISGTMFGSATSDEGVSVEVFGATTQDPALISGRADASSVQGMIMGQLTIAGAACTSAGNNWKLTPRSSRAE